MTETEVWYINGHRLDCAYLRSLDDMFGDHDRCDCGADDDGPDDEDEPEWYS